MIPTHKYKRWGEVKRGLTDVPAMLDVKKSPETRNQSINNRQTPIKRQLRNLRSRKLAICVLKSHNSGKFEIYGGVRNSPNAVVSRLFDLIGDWTLFRKLDGLSTD